MICVYKITNTISGKVYIGLTKAPVARRLTQHACQARRRKSALGDAINSYGIQSFVIEPIYYAFDSGAASCAEKELITTYQSLVGFCGYNIRKGGEVGLAPGYGLKGGKSPAATLDEASVKYIRSVDGISDKDIAEELTKRLGRKIGHGAVSLARMGRTWAHLNEKYPPKLLGIGGRRTKKNAENYKASQRPEVRKKIAASTSKRLKGNAQPWKCKLSESDVRAILLSKDSARALAPKYNVSQATISNVRKGKILTYAKAT